MMRLKMLVNSTGNVQFTLFLEPEAAAECCIFRGDAEIGTNESSFGGRRGVEGTVEGGTHLSKVSKGGDGIERRSR